MYIFLFKQIQFSLGIKFKIHEKKTKIFFFIFFNFVNIA